ncbi:hypothetical protein [Segetibacter aerophilus]|nr:hypothetical protein [Segetibacter aerophilus]
MKLLALLIILTGSSAAVNAQSGNFLKRKPWEEAKLRMLLRDTLSKINPVPNYKSVMPQQIKNGVYQIPITGVYIGENGKGDEIYAMQPDNMPCLVPGKSFASDMPVLGMEKLDKSNLPLLKKGDKKPGE